MSTRTKNKSRQPKIKRYECTVWTIEKEYGLDLGVRSDMKISTYLSQKWFPSLAKILDNK